MSNITDHPGFAALFRHSAPYINAFRNRTFVLFVSGAGVTDPGFSNIVHDIALLHTLGIRLILVHGARPQIDQNLRTMDHKTQYIKDLRITDDVALSCAKDAIGSLKMEIEARLSMGISNSPMAGVQLRVVSGNFMIAQPYGIREGVDYLHTGQIRRVDTESINTLLDDRAIVLLSPMGYSPTGEIFNLLAEDVAANAAKALGADKLLYLMDSKGVFDDTQQPIRELTLEQANVLLKKGVSVNPEVRRMLQNAVIACQQGVHRVHLISRHTDGALLQELFTRDGVGTLISTNPYEGTREASIEDVNGILELITPLEAEGVLVRRSRDYIELEINQFFVVERDGVVIACAALYPFPNTGIAELACLAVHPDYRREGRGDALLQYIEKQARINKIEKLIVLTTHTAHWFQERGFENGDIQSLPLKRQLMYNYQRNSKVFIKQL